MKMDDRFFINKTIELARAHSQEGRNGPFGAIVVRDGQILGEGWNRVVENNDPTAHAEIVAIRQACQAACSFALEGCTIYCSCEPCPMCLAAIYWARISRIVYAGTREDAAAAGFDDLWILDEIKKDTAARSIELVCLQRASAQQVFAEWTANEKKILY
jgi:tRNA(Arg) A34 adenosine deaminase TadA